ncbi:hypothetical protein QBC37DRAFT_392794 [Rhypophila decipiens]|uniref:Uncharacterized protein n=1 Tax=Rhypophila decipiens TaxID=261697 RepID=A0AAN6XXJ1_9PEZI|nr:hypothetical protein QBC37DRAFT_392794 [Rhypophila decipiens]
MSFDVTTNYGASAALTGIPIFAILVLWGISLKSIKPVKPVSQPLRLSLLFLKIAPPFYILGLVFSVIFPAVTAALGTDYEFRIHNPSKAKEDLYRLHDASIYLVAAGSFLANTANIGITMSLYLATIGAVYCAQGRMTWWRLFRVDAPVGAGILVVLNIAWFGRSMTLMASPDSVTRFDRRWLGWLVFIVDFTLAALALGCTGTMIYVMSKLKGNGREGIKRAMGKAPTLILTASIIWLVRSCYGTANILKNIRSEYAYTLDEARASLFIFPILQHWLVTVTLGLLIFAVRNSVWGDASIQPTTSNPVIGGGAVQQPLSMDYQQQTGYSNYSGEATPMMAQQQPPYQGQQIASPMPVQYVQNEQPQAGYVYDAPPQAQGYAQQTGYTAVSPIQTVREQK